MNIQLLQMSSLQSFQVAVQEGGPRRSMKDSELKRQSWVSGEIKVLDFVEQSTKSVNAAQGENSDNLKRVSFDYSA